MKLVHVASLSAALLAGVVSSACSGSGSDGGRQADQAGAQGGQARPSSSPIFRGIELTDAQKAQIDSIAEQYQQQLATLPSTATDSATRAKRREVGERQLTDFRAVLTPDQQQLFDLNLSEIRENRGAPR